MPAGGRCGGAAAFPAGGRVTPGRATLRSAAGRAGRFADGTDDPAPPGRSSLGPATAPADVGRVTGGTLVGTPGADLRVGGTIDGGGSVVRGNGPSIVSTDTGGCAFDEPGATGFGRAPCDGATGIFGIGGTGIRVVPT